MLTLPFLATDATATDATKAPETAEAKTTDRPGRGEEFSDVFDKNASQKGPNSPDSVENQEQDDTPESESGTHDEAPEANGEIPDNTAEDQPDLTTVLKEFATDKPAEGTRSAAEDASAFGKTIRALERAVEPPTLPTKPEHTATPAQKPVLLPTEAAKTTPIPQTTASTPAMQAEVVERLEPMRIQVRATTTAGSAAVQANLQANQSAAVPTVANPGLSAEAQTDATQPTGADVEADTAEDRLLVQSRDQTTAAPSSTQWRAEVTPEKRQTLLQARAQNAPVTKINAEAAGEQTVDTSHQLRDDMQTRVVTSAADISQQSRISQNTAQPAYVVKQVAEAARAAEKGVIEITMDPPELGRLRLSMSETAGTMNITISTENSATSELMRKHIDLLRKDFMEMGYDDVSFSFEQGDMNGQQNSESPEQAGEAGRSGSEEPSDAANADLEPLTTPSSNLPAAGTGGLDIRL
ncbi:flagellar hook-length control protein FliK [Shimia haliotis]|uniref:Hook-length control protein FliK n=1 Tax=Shimia haliotis TaxID=1280847 RepID=A0A1I4DD27_9RHOB|nr:flagellar hook-length control protein FliK [Shimia haliotis]SFK90819.1 hook-length control protein FliK [Shimia haliotis]